MANMETEEEFQLSKAQKTLIAFLGVMVVFFSGFIMYRVWGAKPPSTVKISELPAIYMASFDKNKEMAPSPTGYGGSIKYQKAERQPELYTNFKGNPFSKDYTEDRGHPYAMEDLRESKRISPASKGACITCKTPYVDQAFKEQGWGFASAPLTEMMDKANNKSISCSNCHNPENMSLRVINPAFTEAMQRRGIDVNKASREEMRSYVCAQCHSEYYFVPNTFQVVFPWDKGLTPQEMYEYYAAKPNGFAQDFLQTDSKVPVLKAQHPDYEEWQNGIHGKFGVSCADCHMPYMREGGRKYSSHWMTSPLRQVNEACGTCHNQNKDILYQQVKGIQDNVWQLQHTAGETVAKAHDAITKASARPNINTAELDKARELTRKAQWYWDYVAAANSMGFHNQTQELNTLGQAIDLAHQAIDAANRAAGTNNL
jgi:nitrite reductase (cytochrome c-552)